MENLRKALYSICAMVLSLSVVSAQYVDPDRKVYLPEEKDLKTHESAAWFNNAKLGIFVHWGLYSVPAYAPTKGSIRDIMDNDRKDWFKNNAYAEWYLNTMRIKGSPTYEYHLRNYGEDYDYYWFSKDFNMALKSWSPEKMAEIFSKAGARYVVLTTKHHDGYTLWPSRVHNNNMPEDCEAVSRDIVGELSDAVRDKGMKMGLYYSGGLDWTFIRRPILGIAELSQNTPRSAEYAAVADAHIRELTEKYKPSVLWNDIYYPKEGDLFNILSDYYNLVPEGVINNRWAVPGLYDFTTPEYREYDRIMEEKWESCRGLGYSFGYNQYEDDTHTLSSAELIHLLIDVVSKNGNLLINVGPKPDGSIPEIQMLRLDDLGDWMTVNGDAIYDTEPWEVYGGTSESGKRIRFTRKENRLFVIFLNKPGKSETLANILPDKNSAMRLVGSDVELDWRLKGTRCEIRFPGSFHEEHAYVVEITEIPAYVNQ